MRTSLPWVSNYINVNNNYDIVCIIIIIVILTYIIYRNIYINTASDISTENPTANIMSTVDMSDPLNKIKIVCRSPDNDSEMADNSCNTPARKRQRQAYQTIMNKTRFNEVCKNLVGINTGTSMILTPQLNNLIILSNKSIMIVYLIRVASDYYYITLIL